MDDKNQKERLEQELKFLKESFDAEVISREEFEKGSGRIEKKLREIEKSEKKSVQEKKETAEEKPEAKDEAIEPKTEEKIKLKAIQDEEKHANPAQEQKQEQSYEKPKTETIEKDGKFFKYAVVFVVLMLAAFFAYSLINNGPKAQNKTIPAPEAQKINVVVLNDRGSCFNCDTGRILRILEGWLGPLNAKEADYNTAEGRGMAQKFDANALPMYVLDENITKSENYAKLKRIFTKKNESYVLSEDVAAPNFYFKRELIPNRLDFFAIPNDNASAKAEKNLREFLDAFEINFEKHASTDTLTIELGIKNFPAFLVNNRVKFSGVHTAETIKSNFCKMNKMPECDTGLSKSLV
ncbi:hypothetical protein HYX08_00975 [Candidatus Woesearchaeota archaeon]|nr:hypothetical protein [Candidatus Woesearchaeota archaeon]